jgi:hypothetical protein
MGPWRSLAIAPRNPSQADFIRGVEKVQNLVRRGLCLVIKGAHLVTVERQQPDILSHQDWRLCSWGDEINGLALHFGKPAANLSSVFSPSDSASQCRS